MPIASPSNVSKRKPSFKRKVRVRDAKPSLLIAYDFETTRIQAGTPRPLYVTAYGLKPVMFLESAIDNMKHLRTILEHRFLTLENTGIKFVAWNANNFDAYFVAAALVTDPAYVIRPYLTKGNSLRGMRVMLAEFFDGDVDSEYPKGAPQWEFLDGMAMLGLAGLSLEKFLANFAPSHKKMTGVIDFEREEFDPKNPEHRAYAMRDSEGLYIAMNNAQNTLLEKFNQPLTVTMGGACIKIFQAHIPKETNIRPLTDAVDKVVRDYAMRGGFCYCVKRFQGHVWKYDLNQAYAAAMRETSLPAGDALHTSNGIHRYAEVFIARITATHALNTIPFYCREEICGRIKSTFSMNLIRDSWITSTEYAQLKSEGWKITVKESYCFTEKFSMREYIDKLEVLRSTCEGGPGGPSGTMIKGVGNHSYGKTVEVLEPIQYVLAAAPPQGYAPLHSDESDSPDPLDHLYFQNIPPEKVRAKEYHQPHIGAFITAHVRMVVRRAALISPETWLYADTDCVVFSSDVTKQLDIDPKRYGAWKIEEQGTEFQIIAKKVYANLATGKGSAKGMNVRRLTLTDFDDWYHAKPPIQKQVQRNNFLKVMNGSEMYRDQTRTGTRVEITK